MRNAILIIVLAHVGALAESAAQEQRRDDSILLSGNWEYAVGQGDEGAEDARPSRPLTWRPVRLPGLFVPWTDETATKTRCVWARRTFDVTPAQAARMAVLRWSQIMIGASVWVNGRHVGTHELTCPYQVIVPAGVLRPGLNVVVLAIRGAAAVPRAKSGYFLVPAGFASASQRELPAVYGDVWIDFADDVYVAGVLAVPDLAGRAVGLRVSPIGAARVADVTLQATVTTWPEGAVVGRGSRTITAPGDPTLLGGHTFTVDVPLEAFRPWSHVDPALLLAEVRVSVGERELDRLSFRFGMREIAVAAGDYTLNQRPVRLLGSNLVFEWDWDDFPQEKALDYLVREAREMNVRAFRTHTRPPSTAWADLADEHGVFLLAEFPCLWNYRDFGFTAAEYEIWHRNVLRDAAGWMTRLWNHPSVLLWVLSNESNRDGAWESGPYRDFVTGLDPTRPVMRTGDTGTAENLDVHACNNLKSPREGELIASIPGWIEAAGSRTLTNSEYMNTFARPPTQWTGRTDRSADDAACAQLGAEHTEAMRRARLDAVLPYQYAGWTRTRRRRPPGPGGFGSPFAAAWHSALAPVLASLDLFDANHVAGRDVITPLVVVNDSWEDAEVAVELLLTEADPAYVPESPALDAPLFRVDLTVKVAAGEAVTRPVTWTPPAREGSYWLTARTRRDGARPVLSQRFVRAVAPATMDGVAFDGAVVLQADDAGGGRRWLQRIGLTTTSLEDAMPDRDVVLIWNPGAPADEATQQTVKRFVLQGGRAVALESPDWSWPTLLKLRLEAEGWSRAFLRPDATTHPALAAIRGPWLSRWNGLPGTVATARIRGPRKTATPLLWAREPETVVTAQYTIGRRGGTLLVSELAYRSHVDPDGASYDPAAERVLLAFLTRPSPR